MLQKEAGIEWKVCKKKPFEEWLKGQGMEMKDFLSSSPGEQRKTVLLYSYGLSDTANESLYYSERGIIEEYRQREDEFSRQRVEWWDYIQKLLGEKPVDDKEIVILQDEFKGTVVTGGAK